MQGFVSNSERGVLLPGLSQLKYVNLSKTKITDAGLQCLVANACFKDSLETLLLDGCAGVRSSDTLPLINDGKP